MTATSTKAKQEIEQTVKTIEKDIQPAQKFWTKINNDWVFNLSGALAYSLLMSIFPFFLVIYIVVPNQHITLRNSWLGALGTAIALQLYLTLFPWYVAHFLNTFAGPISLVILLVFFYYFAFILLLGAEVNAFFLEKVTRRPHPRRTMGISSKLSKITMTTTISTSMLIITRSRRSVQRPKWPS